MEQKKLCTIYLTFVEIKKDEMGRTYAVKVTWKYNIKMGVRKNKFYWCGLPLDREQQQVVVNTVIEPTVQKYLYKLNNLSSAYSGILPWNLLFCRNLYSYSAPPPIHKTKHLLLRVNFSFTYSSLWCQQLHT